MPKTKNILFIAHDMGSRGAEKTCLNLIKFLYADSEISLSLALFKKQGELLQCLPKDLTIYDFGGLQLYRFPLLLWKTRKLLYEKRFDTILSFSTFANIVTLIAARNMKYTKPKIIIRHEIHTSLGAGRMRFFKAKCYLIRKLYPSADSVIAVSKGVANDLIDYFGIPSFKLKVIYSPVELNQIENLKKIPLENSELSAGMPIVSALGRFYWQKGFNYLLEAMALLVSNGQAIKLVIIGDGPLRKDLERLAKKLGIDKNVFFTGLQENPFKFLARSTVFVCSSLWEGLPNVLLEAIACGVPVISTDCPSGPSEVIKNGVNGMLVPLASSKALAEAMFILINNPDLRQKFVMEGKKAILNFGIEEIAKEYKDALLLN